jgi:MG2 domain
MTKKARLWWLIAAAVGGTILLGIMLWPRSYCRSAKTHYGIEVPVCPDGKLHQTLQIQGTGLHRGDGGTVRLSAKAHYTVKQADSARWAVIPRLVKTRLTLVGPGKKERPLKVESGAERRLGWRQEEGYAVGKVTLPTDLHDGDYILRAHVVTKVGKGTVDLPLGLYAPARIHVMTDRPLYEPGNRVQFRALALRARDLTPIDHRPGRWVVKDPAGTVLLEEKAPAGEWGVVAGSFPLDSGAPTGTWTVTWRSGLDEGTARIKVEPFTLPRFSVKATPDRPFYSALAKPRIEGQVVYSSGAPVQGAKVQLRWSVNGAWPPPASWLAGALPRQAATSAAGRFSLNLPAVPADLLGRVTLTAQLSAVDPAGDRVAGSVSVLLSQHAIDVATVTPLSGGLVGGFNNRLYLRITTADGRPLPGAQIKVRKAWLASDPGVEATLDADSVGRIQLDPGAPVNVVLPAPPVRKAAASTEVVTRTKARDLVAESPASLNDQVELDRWLKLVEPCARLATEEGDEARLALRVSAAGAIVSAAASSALGRCALERIKGRRLPAGPARLYELVLAFSEPNLPGLEVEVDHALVEPPEALTELLEAAARDARDCLPRKVSMELPWVLHWQLRPKAKKPTVSWIKAKGEEGQKMPPGVERCITARLARQQLSSPADAVSMGVARYTLKQADDDDDDERPQPKIMKGYELLVSAAVGGKPAGQTRLRMTPGTIPRLALRADPVITAPGKTITLRMLRGPSYRGDPPQRITVSHLGNVKTIKLRPGAKSAKYVIPVGKKGWFAFSAGGARALVFARVDDDLTVAVTPDRQRYAPGSRARLKIRTRVGKRGAKAAVGLFGVDATLAQLVTLPDAKALGGLRPEVTMHSKAFDLLDGQALSLGRIKGKHAAEATVLRVASVPSPAALDAVVNASANTTFDPNAVLTDRFYTVLMQLHLEVRGWERSAPAKQLMKPSTMAALWQKALEACKKRGQPVEDAFGRKLRLHRLPQDLLALTDPRQVVAVGTRLPEDVENWPRWVARRKP